MGVLASQTCWILTSTPQVVTMSPKYTVPQADRFLPGDDVGQPVADFSTIQNSMRTCWARSALNPCHAQKLLDFFLFRVAAQPSSPIRYAQLVCLFQTELALKESARCGGGVELAGEPCIVEGGFARRLLNSWNYNFVEAFGLENVHAHLRAWQVLIN